jgi:hypothetical protein
MLTRMRRDIIGKQSISADDADLNLFDKLH